MDLMKHAPVLVAANAGITLNAKYTKNVKIFFSGVGYYPVMQIILSSLSYIGEP
jgi:hypothetical protein